ncbi:Excreted virulence factor EspC, type VII ESX diderm [Thermomonospora echinospora]|uniref:Excreted virulence factor EspC, type VII ESX diderm n=1 Tax=Thermomonospora echinospora TaxID=1992 RepID=A0A1H6CCA1_9ACTN|nr:hypothetical protein [Thermomonospora echinospora]SEG70601.1 Excreted virulence factor EspC, type VII ESX diderm [Thermomonospora echinospora]
MTFRVTPSALEEFSRSLHVLAGDAEKAVQYVGTHGEQVEQSRGYALGLLYSLGVLRICEAVQQNTRRLESLTTASATELTHCADVYRRTDKKNTKLMEQISPK